MINSHFLITVNLFNITNRRDSGYTEGEDKDEEEDEWRVQSFHLLLTQAPPVAQNKELVSPLRGKAQLCG
jgi:hypothetical protein